MKDVPGKRTHNTRVGPNSITKSLRGTREDQQIALIQDMVVVAIDLLRKIMLVIAGSTTGTNSKISSNSTTISKTSSTSIRNMQVLRKVKMVRGADTNRISLSEVIAEVDVEACATIIPRSTKTLTSSTMMVEAGVGIVRSMI